MTDEATEAEDTTAPAQPRTAPSKFRWLWWTCGILMALLAWNATVFVPVYSSLSDEEGATTIAYRSWLISPNHIVFDIWSVDGSMAMVDMDRRLFKAAEALQGRSYDSVSLAYRGQSKLVMDGAYFQQIGANRLTENPVYTMRTMQEHVTNPDGSPAFGVWTGGWIGVLGKQLEDHNEFHRRWWVNPAIGDFT